MAGCRSEVDCVSVENVLDVDMFIAYGMGVAWMEC